MYPGLCHIPMWSDPVLVIAAFTTLSCYREHSFLCVSALFKQLHVVENTAAVLFSNVHWRQHYFSVLYFDCFLWWSTESNAGFYFSPLRCWCQSKSVCCGHTRDQWSSAVRAVFSHPTTGTGGELEGAQLCTRQLWIGFSHTRRHFSPAPAGAGSLCSTYFGIGWSITAMCQHLPLLEPLQTLWNHHLCRKSSKILWACSTVGGTVLCFQMTSLVGSHIARF